jgi:dTDP-glucose 4,6-dehydratase
MVLNALDGRPLPVYGDGANVRDWLYVEDHCEAVWQVMAAGRTGETYNIGGECELRNIDVVRTICDVLQELRPARSGAYRDLITFVADRPGHDRRYAINCDKIKRELGWRQRHDFPGGLRATIAWYLENRVWVDGVRSGEYQRWIDRNYSAREHR